MRIGMLADAYKPHISGVTNYISTNKIMLEKLGHEVFVFTFGDQDLTDDERWVIRSPGIPLTDTGFYFSFRYSPIAKNLIQTMDLVHVHHPFLSGRLALRYCKPLGIPIVFTNHTRYDLYLQTYFPVLSEGLGTTFLQAYMPSFCRSVDLVIAPSKGLEAVLYRIGVDAKMEVVPNGVDLSGFRDHVPPADRSVFGFTDDDVVLVYAGRLAPEKNLSFLMRSFTGLVQAYSQAKLLVIGTGPEAENLQAMVNGLGIGDSVKFTGLVPYSEIPRYLKMCDVFVTASVTEVHPLSVIEAMAAGLPVLGIDSPGVGDTIEDGVNGFLATEDIAAFTAKLVRLVGEPGQRKYMGEAACQTAEKYSIERTIKAILTQYERLVEQSNQKRHGLRFRVRSITERWRK